MHLEPPQGCCLFCFPRSCSGSCSCSSLFHLLSSSAHRQLSMLTFYSLVSVRLTPPLPPLPPVTANWPAVRNACTFIRIANNFKQKLSRHTTELKFVPTLSSHRETASATRRPHSQPLGQASPSPSFPHPHPIIIGIIIMVACSGMGVAARTTPPPLVNAKSQGWHKCCPSTWPGQLAGTGSK